MTEISVFNEYIILRINFPYSFPKLLLKNAL